MHRRLIESPGLAALLGGLNEKALALLHGDRSPGAAYSRARALFRIGDFGRTIAEARQVNPSELDSDEAVALIVVHSFALGRIGKISEAYEVLSIAEAIQTSRHDDLSDLEVLYGRAYLQYCEKRHDSCILTLQDIISRTSNVADDRRKFSFQPDSYALRARAATFLGVIYGSRDQFSEMEKWHCDALLSAEKSQPRDSFMEAVILANLSCNNEVYSPSSTRILRDRLSLLDWAVGMDEQWGYVRRALQRIDNLFGNETASSDRAHVSISPSLAWRLAESVDQLLISSWSAESAFLDELRFATTIMTRIDWNLTSGEEAAALNSLAILLAPYDLEYAREADRLHGMRVEHALPHYPMDRTNRGRAGSLFAFGCIAKASGDWAIAIPALRASLATFASSRIVWRASTVALELFTLTRDHALLDTPREFIAAHPFSPFSKRLRLALKLAPEAERGAFIYLKGSITE